MLCEGSGLLGIIPARGGSKGIKDKNIKPLNGKPLINYVIESAQEAHVFDKVIVSTDSDKIADAAEKCGAEVPFVRPAEYATDESSSEDVLVHALKYFNEKGSSFDVFAMLQPTTPLTRPSDIREALDLFFREKANAVVSVCKVEHSPVTMNEIPENMCMDNFIDTSKDVRRQNFERYFRLNGAIYIARTDYFLRFKNFYQHKCYAYEMPVERSIDIDNTLDLKFCELLIQEEN